MSDDSAAHLRCVGLSTSVVGHGHCDRDLAAAAVALHPMVVRYDPCVALTAAVRRPARFARFMAARPPLLEDQVRPDEHDRMSHHQWHLSQGALPCGLLSTCRCNGNIGRQRGTHATTPWKCVKRRHCP